MFRHVSTSGDVGLVSPGGGAKDVHHVPLGSEKVSQLQPQCSQTTASYLMNNTKQWQVAADVGFRSVNNVNRILTWTLN